MTNRHRFQTLAIAGLVLAASLSGCMAPQKGAGTVQRSPNISHPLTAGTSVISPYDGLNATTDDSGGAVPANQRVVRVGLLVPLSGRNAELGKAMRDAAAVSLFDKYSRLSPRAQAVRVELLPKDTGDTPDQAAEAMNQALADGAQFIIGPVFADAAAVAAPIARSKNISVLSFSNTRTQASPGTYMFGFSPAEQAERIVTYAMRNGKGRIAVIAPNSPLGDTVVNAARNTLARSDMKFVAEARYSSQGAGMDAALNGLIQAGKPPAFDAILVPEGGQALETILRGLSARGAKPGTVQLLGTGLWDDAELLRRVNLDGAWFASSTPQLTGQFEERFRATYSYSPPRVTSLAYDAVALAVTLATSNRPFDAVSLTNAGGFAGPANGIFRLRADGTTQRGLAVMQVSGGTLKVISPSPNSF